MDTFAERLAAALLVVAGLLTIAPLLAGQPAVAGALPLMGVAEPALAWVLRGQFLVGLLGLGLVAAAFFRPLRLPLIAGAAVSKLAFLALALSLPASGPVVSELLVDLAVIALLAVAGLVFFHAMRQEARWDGMLPLRPEA